MTSGIFLYLAPLIVIIIYSHFLIHLVPYPRGQYLNRTVEFSSAAIMDKVVSRMNDDNVFKELELLKRFADDNSGIVAGMYGQIFEVFG